MSTAAAMKYPGPRLAEPPVQNRTGRSMTGADAQLEHGNFSQIHNLILEALSKIDLSGIEMRLLLFLLRQTYGWKTKEKELSYQEFADGISRDEHKVERRVVIRALNKLQERNIIKAQDNGDRQPKTWSFNKYYEQWTEGKTASDQNVTSDQEVTRASDQNVTQLNKREINTTPSPLPPTESNEIKPGEYLPGLPDPRKQRTTQDRLNEQVAPAFRTPVVEILIDAHRLRPLIDESQEEDALVEMHDMAVKLYKMGFTDTGRVQFLVDDWYQCDWRGKQDEPPGKGQLVKYASALKSKYGKELDNGKLPASHTRPAQAAKRGARQNSQRPAASAEEVYSPEQIAAFRAESARREQEHAQRLKGV